MSPGNLPEKGNFPTNKNMPPNIINITPKNRSVLPNRLNSDIFIFPCNKITIIQFGMLFKTLLYFLKRFLTN